MNSFRFMLVSMLVALTVGGTALAVMPAAASTATPPSLAGEELTYDPHIDPPMSTSCSGTPSGTGTYSVSGHAVGPYTGTFTEVGSFTYDSTGAPQGTGTVTATFTITTDDGSGNTVTGTASYPAPDPSFGLFRDCDGRIAGFAVEAAYSATIHTSVGAFHDEGLSGLATVTPSGFDHSFETSLAGGPVPAAPTSKGQCTSGGWKTFGNFKNQGDCVSFVARGGK